MSNICPPCKQEIDGVRTSNGIQYRLQLLYSNGELSLAELWPVITQVNLCEIYSFRALSSSAKSLGFL